MLPARPGQRFALHHAPAGACRAAYVYLHPFAEEMNKSRRMAALAARALASQGVAVLQIDLHGCGDSSGDLSDAHWDEWIDDALMAHRWLSERYAIPAGFWGLRAGCLLASAAARRIGEPLDFIFWQPVPSGQVLLTQFLRLASAAAWTGRENVPSTKALRASIAQGETVEVAGYRLGPGVAEGLELARLAPPAGARRGLWLDLRPRIGNGEDPLTLAPPLADAFQAWRHAHEALELRFVEGPSFWQTQEIEVAPQLLDATLDHVNQRAEVST